MVLNVYTGQTLDVQHWKTTLYFLNGGPFFTGSCYITKMNIVRKIVDYFEDLLISYKEPYWKKILDCLQDFYLWL